MLLSTLLLIQTKPLVCLHGSTHTLQRERTHTHDYMTTQTHTKTLACTFSRTHSNPPQEGKSLHKAFSLTVFSFFPLEDDDYFLGSVAHWALGQSRKHL